MYTEGTTKPLDEPRLLCVSHVKHARDNVAKPAEVRWSSLAARLTQFAVRADIVERTHRAWTEIDDCLMLEPGTWEPEAPWYTERRAAMLWPKLLEKAGGDTRAAVAVLRDRMREDARRYHKSRQPAWIPARFRTDRRARDQVVDVHLAVLDMDDGHPIADEIERWRGHAFAVHTSWSHTEAHPKFRVVLPLARPVTAALWPRVFQHLQVRCKGTIDPQTKNADRIFFLPAVPRADAPRFAKVFEGEWLAIDAERLPKTPAEVDQARVNDRRRARRRRSVYGSAEDLDREARRAMREDPEIRRHVAHRLGAELHGEYAKKAPCPNCSRRSVWFYIVAGKMAGAECAHRNSCGWQGSLEEL